MIPMKTSSFAHSLGIAALMLAGSAAAAPVMRDAATHEQLGLAQRKERQVDPMKSLQKPADGKETSSPDPSVANRPPSLLGSSDIVCFNGLATLVPKRAIIQSPKNLAERTRMQPGAKLQSWSQFYAANRGWITTVEVSRMQAEGNQPLAEETQKQIAKNGNLIVAVYQGGPISLLPLKTSEEPKTITSKQP